MAAVEPEDLLFATPRLDVPSRWRPSDRDGFAEINADPEVMRLVGYPLSRADSDAFADYGEAAHAQGLGLLPVIRRSDGAFLGLCGLHHMRWYPEEVEVGWRFGRAAWGQGYATEVAERWLDHAFGPAGLDRVISITRLEHDRSVAVMHRLGMTELLRDRKADRRDVEVDVIVHTVTGTTWTSGDRETDCRCRQG